MFKIDLSAVDLANTPHEAAYLGSSNRDEIPRAIFVDELGYIYIAGTSNSDDNDWFNGVF